MARTEPWYVPSHLRSAFFEACSINLNHAVTTIIGGSFVVNREKANDIDVYFLAHPGMDANYWSTFGYEKQVNNNGVASEMEYATDFAIIGHWRKGYINLIGVRPEFWAAYVAAVQEMQRNPGLYEFREDRINMHRKMRDTIRRLMDPEATLEDASQF